MSIEGARHPDAFSLRPSDRDRTERASPMSVVEDGGADKVAELATVGLVEAVDVERMGVVEHRAGRGCRCRRQDAPLALGVASRERVFKNDQGATSSERAPLRRLCSQTTASTGRPNAFMIFLGGGRALGSDARWLSATLGNSRWPGDPAESAYFAGCGPRYLPRGRWVEAANKRRARRRLATRRRTRLRPAAFRGRRRRVLPSASTGLGRDRPQPTVRAHREDVPGRTTRGHPVS
jgi:hypothetical protein